MVQGLEQARFKSPPSGLSAIVTMPEKDTKEKEFPMYPFI